MHPLLRQVRSVGRRAHRYLVFRGLSLAAAAAILFAAIAGLADWWLRPSDFATRWLFAGMTLLGACWAFLHFVWPALIFHQPEEAIAEWIEERFPDLRDRLSSAVAFAHQPAEDPRFGSFAMRQRLLDDTTQTALKHNLAACLDARGVLRSVAFFGFAVLFVGMIASVDASSTMLATRRVLMPWRIEPWPQRTLLAFDETPSKIASGQDFVAKVIDRRGWLPSEVTIAYWFDDDPASEIREHRTTYAGGKMIHRLPQVTRSFRYRAFGGDDLDMSWHHLEVVEPPRIVDSQIRLTPPAYTGLPETTASDRKIQAFAGTSVAIVGRSSKKLRSAELHFAGAKSKQRFEASIDPDQTHFSLPANVQTPWKLSESGTYTWQLVDADGVVHTDFEGEVDVINDSPPTVNVESPPPQYRVTANGIIPLKIIVRDDLALRQVVLRTGDRTVTLFEQSTPAQITAGSTSTGEEQRIEQTLSLDTLEGVHDGKTLLLKVVATDFLPQENTTELSIVIVSPEDLKQELESRQAELLRRLIELVRLQRTLQSQSKSVLRDFRDSGAAADRANISADSIELGQHRMIDQLAGVEGILELVDQMIAQLKANQLVEPQLDDHLAAVRDELARIGSDLLPPLEHLATRSAKLVRLMPPTDPTPKTPMNPGELAAVLTDLIEGQQTVIDSLESLIDRLSDWSGYQTLAQEVIESQRSQKAILEETATLTTSSRDLAELTNDERRALSSVSATQNELAARLERLERRLKDMRRKIGDADSPTAKSLENAIQLLEQRSIAARMNEAAQHLDQNRIGVATSIERQIVDDLGELHNALSNSSEQSRRDSHWLIDALRGLESQQQPLIEDTELLTRQADEQGQLTPNLRGAATELARRQSALSDQVDKAADRVDRQSAFRLALEFIATAMDRAAEGLKSDSVGSTTRESQRQALDRLHLLLDALAEKPPAEANSQGNETEPQAPDDPDRTPSNDMNLAELKLLRAWQVVLKDQTREIVDVRTRVGTLSDSQHAQLKAIADEQERLAEMIEAMNLTVPNEANE